MSTHFNPITPDFYPSNGERYVSGEFHGQDQADLGRFFLPEIDPQEAVQWPQGAAIHQALLDEFAEEDEAFEGAYERDLMDSIDIQEARYDTDLLGTEFGATHDIDWEV